MSTLRFRAGTDCQRRCGYRALAVRQNLPAGGHEDDIAVIAEDEQIPGRCARSRHPASRALMHDERKCHAGVRILGDRACGGDAGLVRGGLRPFPQYVQVVLFDLIRPGDHLRRVVGRDDVAARKDVGRS